LEAILKKKADTYLLLMKMDYTFTRRGNLPDANVKSTREGAVCLHK